MQAELEFTIHPEGGGYYHIKSTHVQGLYGQARSKAEIPVTIQELTGLFLKTPDWVNTYSPPKKKQHKHPVKRVTIELPDVVE